MKFWVMAMRVRPDGSRPSMVEALEAGALYPTRERCIHDSGLDEAEWQPVQVEVRMLTKITPPPAAPEQGGTGR